MTITDAAAALRERLHLSRAVLTRYLRTNPRTLENWEQGRAGRTLPGHGGTAGDGMTERVSPTLVTGKGLNILGEDEDGEAGVPISPITFVRSSNPSTDLHA